MKDKNKKKMPYVIIGILVLVIIYLLLRPKVETTLSVADTGSCSNTPNTGYTGYCDDGGRYHCYITCTNTPPPTTTIPRPTDSGLPTDGTTCRNYATGKGYLASAWDSSINTITGCQNWVLGHACSVPTKIDLINKCCMWTC